MIEDDYGDGDMDDIPGAPFEYPENVEDIALVAYEALRAYRISQGKYVGAPCWPRANDAERAAHMERVQNLLDDQIEPTDTDPESRLVAAIVGALSPDRG
jgi:hypothetical protein